MILIEFVFQKFLFSGVCLSGVCLFRSLSFRSLSFQEFVFQEFVFQEFVFQEFVFQEFVMAPKKRLKNNSRMMIIIIDSLFADFLISFDLWEICGKRFDKNKINRNTNNHLFSIRVVKL